MNLCQLAFFTACQFGGCILGVTGGHIGWHTVDKNETINRHKTVKCTLLKYIITHVTHRPYKSIYTTLPCRNVSESNSGHFCKIETCTGINLEFQKPAWFHLIDTHFLCLWTHPEVKLYTRIFLNGHQQ